MTPVKEGVKNAYPGLIKINTGYAINAFFDIQKEAGWKNWATGYQ